MMSIKFFDFVGKEFPESELINNEDYHKAFIDQNGLFHLIETYENNKLVDVNSFINDISEINEIFDLYPNLDSIEFDLFIEKNDNYSKYENYFLNRNQITPERKRIHVYGSDIFPIYDRAVNVEDNSNRYLWKHFYYTDLNVKFEFEYEPSGDFKRLTIYDVNMIVDSDNCTIFPETVGVGKNDFNFNWEGMEYYRNAEPILPKEQITTHNSVYKK